MRGSSGYGCCLSPGLRAELEGAKFLPLVDRDSGNAIGLALFDTEEALRAGDAVMNAGPGHAGSRAAVEFFECR